MSLRTTAGEPIGIFLSAKGLTKMEMLSNTDPFAVLFMKDARNGEQIRIGATSVLQNTQNPSWPTQMPIDYYFEVTQEMTVKLYHQDKSADINNESLHQFLGEARFNLSRLMCTPNQTLTLELKNGRSKGEVVIRAEGMTNCSDVLNFDIIGNKLVNVDGFFGRSDPFLRFHRLCEDGSFTMVFQTPHIDNNLNPRFTGLKIPMSELCNGDVDRPLKIEIWDYESSGKHKFMGKVETSVRGIISASGTPFDVIEPVKQAGNRKYVNSGTLLAQNAFIEKKVSFSDFVLGGCELSLMVAIDFTGSNGEPHDPESLHFMHPHGAMNQYQQAITAVCAVLDEYDSDKQYPVFGFGAKVRTPQGQWSAVQHCFPVYGGGLEVHGVDGILNAYRDCVNNVQFSGPTLFSPIIEAASSIAQSYNCSQEKQKYGILLIMTDGEINDMEATIGSIVRASNQPLSIVIVGVGNDPFINMKQLDGDNGTLSYRNTRAARDIVQFVPFREYSGVGAKMLAAAVLKEIPKQFMAYMQQKSISPISK